MVFLSYPETHAYISFSVNSRNSKESINTALITLDDDVKMFDTNEEMTEI